MNRAADVDRQLAAALERIGHVARVLQRQAAAAHGLSPIQAEVLIRLARSGQRLELTGLSAEFDVSAASLSESLAALRRKGLVVRHVTRGDRRRIGNELTAAGRATAAALADWDEPLRRRVGTLGFAAKGALLASLLDVIAGLVDDGVIRVARTCTTCRFLRTDPRGRHRCTLLRKPLPPTRLRADCPEHEPA